MKNIIICEGSTDYFLLQYFMQKANGWEDKRRPDQLEEFKKARELIRGEDHLIIGAAGGSNRILPCTEKILESNSLSAIDEEYNNIVLLTDRDEENTEQIFLTGLKEIFDRKEVTYPDDLAANQWMQIVHKNGFGLDITIRILLLVIPFDKKGALETFLLDAISEQDEYDKEIIQKGNEFVDHIDPEQRYLNKRRYKTKAKFDVYFSIRTSAEQFAERRSILKSVDWENYTRIQADFEKLSEL